MQEEKELRARVPYGTTQAQTGGNEGGRKERIVERIVTREGYTIVWVDDVSFYGHFVDDPDLLRPTELGYLCLGRKGDDIKLFIKRVYNPTSDTPEVEPEVEFEMVRSTTKLLEDKLFVEDYYFIESFVGRLVDLLKERVKVKRR